MRNGVGPNPGSLTPQAETEAYRRARLRISPRTHADLAVIMFVMKLKGWPFVVLIVAGGLGLVAGAASEAFLREVEVRHIAFPLALPLPLYATGVFAYRKRPELPMARLLLVVGSLWAITWGLESLVKGISERYDSASWVGVFPVMLTFGVTLAATATFFALFPSGRVERRYERWLVRAIWVTVVAPALLLVSDPTLSIGESGDLLEVSNPVALEALEWLKSPAESIGGLPFLSDSGCSWLDTSAERPIAAVK
jgi:hypothetical protein